MIKLFIYMIRALLVLGTISSLFTCFAVLASSHNIDLAVKLSFIGTFLISLAVMVLSFLYPRKYRVQL